MVRSTTQRLGMTSKPLAWAERLTTSIRQAASAMARRSFWPAVGAVGGDRPKNGNRRCGVDQIKKANVSKKDWLLVALEALATSGVASVKVERLAKQLGVAKSGFYWHYKDRPALLRELLRYWEEEYTGVVIAEARLMELAPRDRLSEIVRMIHKLELNKYDLSFQAWATSDMTARKVVSRVIDRRLRFVRETFRELGLSGDELEMRTMLFVAYHSWEATTFSHMPTRKLKRLVKRRIDLLCKVG